jgi:hypothetical protein
MSDSSRSSAKPKKCRMCKQGFEPRSTLQMCCSPTCAIAYARSQPHKVEKTVAKAVRDEKREYRVKNKTISQYLKEVQREFNRFIRERDHGKCCISCGRNTGAKTNAGHYRTTAAASHLRFNEDNVHLQCESCNTYLSGNIVEYRKALIGKIGLQRVEALENDNEPVHWTRDGLLTLRRRYVAAWRELKAAREAL